MKASDPWEKNILLSSQLKLALRKYVSMLVYQFAIDVAGQRHLGTGKPSSRTN